MNDKLKMQTANKADENFKKLAAMFPNAVTETIDENGEVVRAIDKDVLMQEINTRVVDGNEERYQFTWPDKKKSVLLANAPINKTLRPCREESVDFDNTENLYIEGDNLEVLKLLQETYLGKIKMIYIDPPYNTGNDFVYEDNFAQSTDEYLENSGQFDDEGNRLVKNLDSNGRFHTDWLNMIYPRLRLAKDLLTDDGVIFISIDDNEQENLKKLCDEVFGKINFVAMFPWRKRTAKSDVPFGVSQDYEWVLSYCKTLSFRASIKGKERKYYETADFPGRPWRIHDMTKQTTASERPNSYFTMINPKNGAEYPCDPNRTWRITKDTFQTYYDANEIVFPGDYDFLNITKPQARYFKDNDMKKDGENFGRVALSTKLPEDIGMSQNGTKEMKEIFGCIPFSFPKTTNFVKYFINACTKNGDYILDFFSGSATTAHAVMQLNAEDGGHRKFIMVQLPEKTDEKSEAYKSGYKNICEIGKERIRRAGNIIMQRVTSGSGNLKGEGWGCGMPSTPAERAYITKNVIDTGFRVLKCDTSNMKDVYYNPSEFNPSFLDAMEDNIKDDRMPEDLLFQVMLDLGILLSSKIQVRNVELEVRNYTYFDVADGFLIACFDKEITTDVITEIAKKQPYYFVMRDNGFADDSVAANFEQIFATYSPDTVRKVL